MNKGLNEASGLFERVIRENSQAGKRETVRSNTAKLAQPRTDTAASMHGDIRHTVLKGSLFCNELCQSEDLSKCLQHLIVYFGERG